VIPSTESFRLIFDKDKYTEVNQISHNNVWTSRERDWSWWREAKQWVVAGCVVVRVVCRLLFSCLSLSFVGSLSLMDFPADPRLCVVVIVVDACKDSDSKTTTLKERGAVDL
jgi:D-alanyl-lipoteichoic acid acyltransferase DltB (MBOAT superfamily)